MPQEHPCKETKYKKTYYYMVGSSKNKALYGTYRTSTHDEGMGAAVGADAKNVYSVMAGW